MIEVILIDTLRLHLILTDIDVTTEAGLVQPSNILKISVISVSMNLCYSD